MGKEKNELSWPAAFAFAIFMVCGVVAVAVLMWPSHVYVECEFDNWMEVPNGSQAWNLAVFEEMNMYPDHTRCVFDVDAPMVKLGWMLQ